MSLIEEPIRLGLRDAGELLTVQRAAFVTEAQLHALSSETLSQAGFHPATDNRNYL
jgi:hypothetical protein